MKKNKVYAGSRINVYSIESENDKGKLIKRDLVDSPGAVVILALVDDEHLIMIRNERFAVGKTLWELPAGTLEKGEQPEATARRELIEETGYEAQWITLLTSFYSSPGFCNEKLFAYAAKDLKLVGQHLDDSEKITVEILSWDKVLQMIQEGTIEDGKTLATLLFYKLFYKH